jgi:hypothetical protein
LRTQSGARKISPLSPQAYMGEVCVMSNPEITSKPKRKGDYKISDRGKQKAMNGIVFMVV